MRKTLSLLLAFVTIPAVKQGVANEVDTPNKANRPNILYLYVDDMGWGSIGPNGQAERKSKNLPYVRTPNLNQLAAEGVNFTRGYGCHVCSPARSSQQTGFHQGHTFADRNDPDNGRKAIRADDVTMGDVLSTAGYTTGYWGKWGYGGTKEQQAPQIVNVQTLPTSHGYKHVLAELHHVRAHTFFQPTLWKAPTANTATGGIELVPNSLAQYKAKPEYPNAPALQNHADYPNTAYCDDTYSFAALDFVRTQSQEYNRTGKPFFGLLAVQIPHAPFGEVATLPDWSKAYAGDPNFENLADQTQQWAAMVTRIDEHFGNILAALEDPNSDGDKSDSVVDNTLVIFQSDNGGPRGKSNVEMDANGGLSGVKGNIQEGGIRVPLVMRWPARINSNSNLKPGTDSEKVVDVTDLLPTFCELANVETPVGIDGVSIAPTLTGVGHQRQRGFLIHEAKNGNSIIQGNGKFKLVQSKKSFQLYDLIADPSESKNVANQFPGVTQKLKKLLRGERVDEKKGFANTYHEWTGKHHALASDPDNWSDYVYSNAGVTHMKDAGSPKLSWIARMENHGNQTAVAKADDDLEFLGLSIAGHPENDLRQVLQLGKGIDLTARNEFRLMKGATLQLNQGKISSLRWIDIHVDAVITGSGTLNANVQNSGQLKSVAWKSDPGFRIEKDFVQTESGELVLELSASPSIRIDGSAKLAGTLSVASLVGIKQEKGTSIPILTAGNIVGTFANENDLVTTADGSEFQIRYTDTEVSIVPQ